MGNLPGQVSSLTMVALTGVAWGVYLDLYRTWTGRRLGKRSLSRGLWDLVFWLGSAALLSTGLIAGNWLELRLYVFVGLVLGYAGYALLARAVMQPVYRGLIGFVAAMCYPWRLLGERWFWRRRVWWRRVTARQRSRDS